MTRWLWTAANGLVTDLSAWSAGNYVTRDRQGIHAPGYDFVTENLSGVDGATVLNITAQPAVPTLAIDWTASDPVELAARVRALAHAMRPRAGIGKLTAVGDDGAVRTLPCYYSKGLDAGVFVTNRFRAVLEFFAPSPWWRGDQIVYPWSLSAPTAFFPILPLQLSPSAINSVVTFDLSDTDSLTYPTWKITGPGNQLALINYYTRVLPDGSTVQAGKAIGANGIGGAPLVGDGQTVTIVTAPGQQRITRSDGVELLGYASTDPALFPLVDDVNTITAVLTGSTANSSILLTADRLYSGAL